MSFYQQLEKYAELAVKVGVNVEPGQTLMISASIDTAEFVRLITEKAYQAGAKQVYIEWQDPICTRLKYELAPTEAFDEYPRWQAMGREELAEKGGAYLVIESNDPEWLKGVDADRISAASKAAGIALKKWRKSMLSDQMSWCIIAAASRSWAKRVFPEKEEAKAVEALWNAIFQATRVDQEDPEGMWKKHNAFLQEKIAFLNQKRYKKLHYQAPGTDLIVELPDHHIWCGGSAKNERGTLFNPNIPTEEVYTAPLRLGTRGTVRSTKPLSYQGNLIENFSLRFENGQIVGISAEKGIDALQSMIGIDEGAAYLGEIALVPHDSPISNTDLIFYNTLYDENASCHLAIGSAISTCIEGGTELSPEELRKAGLNESMTHVDFMIGSADLDIDGKTDEGIWEPIFRKGNWALTS
ncbi:aminopeptidase [Kroppenstedtia guangzhouensis]|uniref:Aminopeptidase n=1 Tax=Kroppenstedtia guangzhouensis TaxID=1274356 RepID=A0ABQ1H1Z3_9BACL|nr:aminopeptidase [Kroppenstedtia guangzhouensis]GGA55123.1 aminopeptidase [Kroppenstedtia guangzhouensis]